MPSIKSKRAKQSAMVMSDVGTELSLTSSFSEAEKAECSVEMIVFLSQLGLTPLVFPTSCLKPGYWSLDGMSVSSS